MNSTHRIAVCLAILLLCGSWCLAANACSTDSPAGIIANGEED
ncbi:MAG: hypothetical protein R3C18_17795 [Planctomycetaceae bacterium]